METTQKHSLSSHFDSTSAGLGEASEAGKTLGFLAVRGAVSCGAVFDGTV